jgi:hypothetical protein
MRERELLKLGEVDIVRIVRQRFALHNSVVRGLDAG